MLTKFPLIFLAYLVVLSFFCIFLSSNLLLFILLISILVVIKRKYYLILVILSIFSSFFLFVKADNVSKIQQEPKRVTQIQPILDSIQVNGDLLSFQAKADGKKYQVYDTLKSEKEQQFYKNLTQNCTISFTGNVEIPEQQRNFNGFDNQKYLETQGIYRQIKINQISKVSLNSTFDFQLLRRKAIVWTKNHFPAPVSSYMTGLLFGYLDKDFEQMGDIYSSLGIIHLFALSGMQVNFFIDWLKKLLLRLGLRKDYLVFIQIPFSIFYAFMTGLSVSIIRALLQKNIKLRGLDNIAITTLVLMFIKPQALLTVGGLLTLLYAFSIGMLSPHFKLSHESIEEKRKRLYLHFRQILFQSLILSLLVLPVLMLNFHIFQPFSIILTLIFGLMFDFVFLPLLLISFISSLLGIILPINPVFQLLEQLVKITDQGLHYPLVLGTPSPFQLLALFILSGLLIDYFSKKKLRNWLVLGIFVLIFLSKNPIQSSITMVDVGQGDSILLQDRFNLRNILIDTGGKLTIPKENWQKFQNQSNADKTLIPYLQSVGVGKIDDLILTHTDDDHVGDFVELANKIKIKRVWVSSGEISNTSFVAKLKQAKIPIHLAQTGESIPIFDQKLQILSSGYTGKGDNNDSIVTYGNFYGKKFLFTGDLEQDGELKLLKNYPTLKVDVLKAGHHGSRTSSNPEFIKQIHPQVALVSVGKNNRYGHPNQETLSTFQKYQVKVIRTDQKGAIKLDEKEGVWSIKTVK